MIKPYYDTSGDGVRVAQPLFPVEGQGSIPMSPLQLNIEALDLKTALEINRAWHSRLPLLPYSTVIRKHGIAFGATYLNVYFAVAIWSTPCARMLDNGFTYELRRMAICNNAPKNTASRMISIMCKILKKKTHYCRLISYQDTEVHTGTIYKASGWIATNKSKTGFGWSNSKKKSKWAGRGLSNKEQSIAPKIRWEKQIRPESTLNITIPKINKETQQLKLF